MTTPRTILGVLDGKAGGAVLATSTLISLWFAVFGGFIFYADAVIFFNNAVQLVHFRRGNYLFTPGYPLLIALTGFPVTGSVVPLLIVQAAFAAFTPWLALKAFARSDRRMGVVAGIVCLASLTPFFFQNKFYHDGTGLFFGFLSIAFASIFFTGRCARYIYLSLASATFAYFVQPAMIGFVIGCAGAFTFFALYDRQQLKHVVAALGILVALVVASSALQKWSLRHDGSTALGEQLGRRLFSNVYLEGMPYGKLRGAAADKLRAELSRFFGSSSDAIGPYVAARLGNQGEEYQDLFGQYEGRGADLVDRIFAQPNRQYFEVLWDLPDMPNGVADDVFLRAALAFIYQHPGVVLAYLWENLVDLTVGLPWTCRGHDVFPTCKQPQGIYYYPTLSHGVVLARGDMPEKAYSFLTSREGSRGLFMRAADAAWQWIYRDLRSILLASMLIGWLASFWGTRELRWTLGAFVGAYATNTLVFSLFVGPEFRYQIPGIAMSAFAAGPGIYAITSLIAGAGVSALLQRFRRKAPAASPG
jgi:hypothetical protein